MKSLITLLITILCYASPCFANQPTIDIKTTDEIHFVEFNNFPHNTDITIQAHRLFRTDKKTDYTTVETIKIDKQGLIHLKKQKSTVGQFALNPNPSEYLLGERSLFRFLDNKGNTLKEFSFIPRPIKQTGKDHTFSVEAELVSYLPTMYNLSFEGIEENESIHVTSKCLHETIEYDVNYSSKNKFAILPAVTGHKGASCRLTLKRTNGDTVTLKLNWGTTLFNELLITMGKGNKLNN